MAVFIAENALGARRLLSTPSAIAATIGAWLGVGSTRSRSNGYRVRAFTEFDGFHSGGFPAGGSNLLRSSPLCLPFHHSGKELLIDAFCFDALHRSSR